MIERRMKIMYWFFNESPLFSNPWVKTYLHIDNWVSFDCFKYRINGVVYKKHTNAFEIAREQEIMWERLK